MDYYEELPPDCPPEEAQPSVASFYRLGSIPPKDSDFWSHRRRFPKKFFRVSECTARSVSVYDDFEAVKKLRAMYEKMAAMPIFQVDLTEKDGLVLQTSGDKHHFSWWRSTQFDLSMIKILDS